MHSLAASMTMKPAAVFCGTLGLAALVSAGPILRSNAVDGLASSNSALAEKRPFDGLFENFVETLNYPKNMVKRSTGFEALSVNDKSTALEAAVMANGDAFEAYIDNMDDQAVRKALSNADIHNAIHDWSKRAFDTNVQAGEDAGLSKRDTGDWTHSKCSFKAFWHHDSEKYYCGCLSKNIYVDDMMPERCDKYDAETLVKRSVDDDKLDSTIKAFEAVDDTTALDAHLDDDTDVDAHLTKRSGSWCVRKCKFTSAFHHHINQKDHYCKCFSKCAKDDNLVPEYCKEVGYYNEDTNDKSDPVDAIDATSANVDTKQ